MPPPAVSGLRVLMFAAFAGTLAMMAFNSVIGPITRLLGLQEWHAGLAVTAAGVLWMLSARRWGALSDRIGRRRVLLVSLVAYALVYLSMAVFVGVALASPPTIWLSVALLVAMRALIGLFYAAVPPTAAAWVADSVGPGERGGVMARLGAVNAMGTVLGPAIAGWLAWRGLAFALYVAAALPFLSLLMVAWRLPPAAAKSPPRSTSPAAIGWTDRRLRMPLATVLVAMASISIAQVSVGFFAMDRLQLSPAEGARAAGLALTAVGIGLICAQALVARLRSIPPLRWIMTGAFIAAIGFSGAMLVGSLSSLMAVHALAAFGMGFMSPSIMALTADSVQPHEQGVAAGTVSSMQGFGLMVGPLLGTLLYRWAPVAPYLFASGVLLLLGASSLWFLRWIGR
ncbi:MAG: MFS transporter [Pseudoxanthomonas sp.]